MTFGDTFRSMSDEQLADIFYETSYCPFDGRPCPEYSEVPDDMMTCKYCWVKYLGEDKNEQQ